MNLLARTSDRSFRAFPSGPDFSGESKIAKTGVSVCHIASGDAWGGAEAQIATLAAALAKRSDVDVSAIVLNQGRLAEELKSCGIPVLVLPQNEKSLLQIASEAEAFVGNRNVGIIHSHRYKENLLAALLKLRNPQLRLVRTQHGWPEPSRGLAGIKQWTAHALDRLTARSSTDTIISVSGQLRKYLRKQVDERRIITIRNGIDLAPLHRTSIKRQAKARLRIGENEFVVGFAGRLEAVKRLDIFAAAAKEIAARIPSVKFVIAGSGRDEQKFRKLICQFGLERNSLLLGHCENSFEVLSAMDLLLITSDHEGLPMVMLEAMALGTVVVSRAVGGIPEVIADNETGILLNSADPHTIGAACAELFQNPEKRLRIAAAAKATVESEYSAERNCDQVVSLYRSLLHIQPSLQTAVA